MKKIFDFVVSLIAILFFLPINLLIFIIILFQFQNPIFISRRVGKNSKQFNMLKIRTLKFGTPIKSTEDWDRLEINKYLLKFGKFLRNSNLDENLQFYSVLLGHMSIVGPRPLLPSQKKLINERKIKKIDTLLPGITGYAQVFDHTNKKFNKIKMDYIYLKNKNLFLDIKIIFLTFVLVIKKIFKIY